MTNDGLVLIGRKKAAGMTTRSYRYFVCPNEHQGVEKKSENDQPYSELWESTDTAGLSVQGKDFTRLHGACLQSVLDADDRNQEVAGLNTLRPFASNVRSGVETSLGWNSFNLIGPSITSTRSGQRNGVYPSTPSRARAGSSRA